MSDSDNDAQNKPEGTPNTKMAAEQIFVSRKFRHKSDVTDESEETEVLAVRKFQTEPAVVGCTYGLTINTGNYNSARVEVTLRLPCYVEEVSEAYEVAKKWVEERVRSEVDGVKKKAGANLDF